MRFISADVLFQGNGPALEQGVVVLDHGVIADVLDNRDSVSQENLEIHEGAICPGFVNAHCHLELSHLHGKIRNGTGLPSFLTAVTQLRNEEDEVKLAAMQKADSSMWEAGIDAVGDISNTADSLPIKEKSKVHYHTYVEVIGLVEDTAESRLSHSLEVKAAFSEAGLSATIAPHSPYSLSDKLRKLVANSDSDLTSMHNQECSAEDEYFLKGEGSLKESICKMGLSMDSIEVTGKSSLKSVLLDYPNDQKLILVHNSHTKTDEMDWANANWPNLFWCSCPGANVYIEYRVPKASEWMNSGATVCLGSDSLASNEKLSILQEMDLTQMRCPDLTTKEIIQMATYNGALALGIEDRFGQITKGRKSGVILLSDIRSEEEKITNTTEVTRLA